MENPELLKQVEAKAQVWLGEAYDEATRKEVKRMLEADDKTELIDAFYRDLEFGTGGLRGIMGAGSNRMNIYTVAPPPRAWPTISRRTSRISRKSRLP